MKFAALCLVVCFAVAAQAGIIAPAVSYSGIAPLAYSTPISYSAPLTYTSVVSSPIVKTYAAPAVYTTPLVKSVYTAPLVKTVYASPYVYSSSILLKK